MTAKTHILGGAIAGVTFSYITGQDLASASAYATVAAIATVGALFPDIDCPSSKIGHAIPIIPKLINKLCGHRGLMHAPLFYVLLHCIFLVLFVNSPLAASIINLFFVGIYSHLILDTFNPQGVPWLFPFKKKKYHLAQIYTNSLAETVFMVCLGLFASGVVWIAK